MNGWAGGGRSHHEGNGAGSRGGAGRGGGGRWGGDGAGEGKNNRGRTKRRFVVWTEDQTSFKVEAENEGLRDEGVAEWLEELRAEVSWSKKAMCSSLNLSRNELGDEGVKEIMNFLVKERIAVQLIKLYKNWISDGGVRAIGDLIRYGEDPVVQEIHLSHNCITADGAIAVFEAVRDSSRYPCNRGRDVSPLWLRMENNKIDWANILDKANEWGLRYAVGDTRDSWRRESSACPAVAMHRSYHHQSQTRHGGGATGSSGEAAREGARTGADDAWHEGGSESSAAEAGHKSHRGGYGGYRGRDNDDRARGHGRDHDDGGRWHSNGWSNWESEDANACDDVVQEFRDFVDDQMVTVAEGQNVKFNLIFSILSELTDRQDRLEKAVRELQPLIQQNQQQQQQHAQVQQQQQQQQQYAVQMVPVEGRPQQQSWGGDQHQFGSGVW